MKLGGIVLILTTLVASSASMAGTISGSSNINFLAFDGQKVKKNSTLQVNDSELHQVVVDVSGLYRTGSEDTFFESDPIVLTFNGHREDIRIIAPELRSENEVEKFKHAPSFKVVSASGQAIDYKQDYLKGEGFMPHSRVIENLARYNAGNGIAAVKSLAVSPMVGMLPNGAAKGQGENIAEQQLQYWFQQADKETKKRFLDWAKKQ